MRLLALIVALMSASAMPAAVISSAERLDIPGSPSPFLLSHSTNSFSRLSSVWYGSSFTYRTVPSYLKGADSLLTLYPDNYDADFQLRITLDVPATVYLLVDDRIPDVAATMPWLAPLGFADTGNFADYLFSSSYVRTLSIYSANFPAGDVVLRQQYSLNNHPSTDGSTSAGMYVIGAIASVPEPETSTLLLGSAGFLLYMARKTKGVTPPAQLRCDDVA